MMTFSTKQMAVAASVVVPIAAMALWHDAWWTALLFALWCMAAAAFLVFLERRRNREQAERLLVHARKSSVRMLSHHRHDWMNELQLVYGYLRMNKPDKAIGIVERIRERMSHDSKITNLGNLDLVTYLLAFRTHCDSMRLEVEVEDGLSLDKLFPDSGQVSAAVIAVVNAFRRRAVSPSIHTNALLLSLGLQSEADGIRKLWIRLKYEGELNAESSLEQELQNVLKGLGELVPAALEADDQREMQARRMDAVISLPA